MIKASIHLYLSVLLIYLILVQNQGIDLLFIHNNLHKMKAIYHHKMIRNLVTS